MKITSIDISIIVKRTYIHHLLEQNQKIFIFCQFLVKLNFIIVVTRFI